MEAVHRYGTSGAIWGDGPRPRVMWQVGNEVNGGHFFGKNPKPATIETVSDEKVITDGTMTVNLYPVTGEHSETMIVAYFPKERLLVEADVYTPGGAVQMFAGGFLNELKKRNLRIDRIVPLHGTVVPYTQFVKEATAPPVPASN